MLKDNNKRKKILALIFGAVLVVIVLVVTVNLYRMKDITIGKMVYIEFEIGDADYLEMLLESENENKLDLFAKEEVRQLIQYMRDNNIRIAPGQYKIPQTSSCEEMINILKFETISEEEQYMKYSSFFENYGNDVQKFIEQSRESILGEEEYCILFDERWYYSS